MGAAPPLHRNAPPPQHPLPPLLLPPPAGSGASAAAFSAANSSRAGLPPLLAAGQRQSAAPMVQRRAASSPLCLRSSAPSRCAGYGNSGPQKCWVAAAVITCQAISCTVVLNAVVLGILFAKVMRAGEGLPGSSTKAYECFSRSQRCSSARSRPCARAVASLHLLPPPHAGGVPRAPRLLHLHLGHGGDWTARRHPQAAVPHSRRPPHAGQSQGGACGGGRASRAAALPRQSRLCPVRSGLAWKLPTAHAPPVACLPGAGAPDPRISLHLG